MPRIVAYYFSFTSPWAYIGHAAFMDVTRRHGVAVAYHPVVLGDVFGETGGLPLPKRHPSRQKYRMVELQRWREKRGLAFHLKPAFWPFDAALADRLAIAVAAAGHDPDALVRRIMSAVWERQENAADPDFLAAVLAELGLPSSLLDDATGPAATDEYKRNFEAAVASDVFGSPGYVVDGEVFWGQDRIELLDDMLSSGRAPFTADV